MFIDFKALKQLCSLEMVANWLGLEVNNGRCQCPVNEGDKRELVLTYDKGIWTCFGCKKRHDGKQPGGDQIELVAHILQVDQKQAAHHLQTKFHGYTPAVKGLPPEGLDYLEFEHEAVQAFGISAQRAEELGIGFAPRGTMIKRVLFPLRDTSGKLLGYLGLSPGADAKLPKGLVS